MTTSGGMQGGSRHWRAASSAACASHTNTAAVARLWSCDACPASESSCPITSQQRGAAQREDHSAYQKLCFMPMDHMLTALSMHSQDLPPTRSGKARQNQLGWGQLETTRSTCAASLFPFSLSLFILGPFPYHLCELSGAAGYGGEHQVWQAAGGDGLGRLPSAVCARQQGQHSQRLHARHLSPQALATLW